MRRAIRNGRSGASIIGIDLGTIWDRSGIDPRTIHYRFKEKGGGRCVAAIVSVVSTQLLALAGLSGPAHNCGS